MRKTEKSFISALGILACCLSPHSLQGQIYSTNIVGYYNLPIYAGENLVANQFDNLAGNSLNSLFQNNIPEGATFTEWDPSQLQFLPLSTYDTNSGWSINYQLTYGEGGLLDSPAAFTNTFLGSIWPGFSTSGPFNPPLISSNGLFLLSCYVPFTSATFYDVVGRNPVEGDYVEILNALTQTETTSTFHNGVWNNGDPLLSVGESAFFGLDGTDSVPEPSVGGLIVAGVLGLKGCQRFRRK